MRSGANAGYVVLGCDCGEKVVVLGREDDWRPRRPVFRCECGQNLTLDDRADDQALTVPCSR